MSAYLSPIGNEVQTDTNGAPLVGGKIYTYLAGTTSAAATYTSSAGSVSQANPIILNAQGLAANPIWLGSGVAMKLVIKDASDVTIRTIDNVLGVNDPSGVTAQDQWASYSGTPTFISATSFSVAGDQTSTFQVGRRIRTTNAGGTIYSSITASAFGAGITTITVTNDSGTLDASLSQVSYGIISKDNSSLSRATLGFTAAVIDRAYAEYTSNADISTVIPLDDTIPQVGEGTQILSAAITPKSTSSRIRIRFQCEFVCGGTGVALIAAAFANGAANAIKATYNTNSAAGFSQQVILEFEYAPASLTAQTITIRVGPSSSTVRLNGTASGRLLGGTMASTLILEEIA